MKYKTNLKIFLVFNGVGEIVSSRIIEKLISQGINKKEIYILKPYKYQLSLLKGFNILKFKNKEIDNKQKIEFVLKTKVRSFMQFIHKKNKLFSMIFSRLAFLPISLKKVILIDESLLKSESFSFKNNLSIYTPNAKLHLFQYLVLMAENFEYHLIEEGKCHLKKSH